MKWTDTGARCLVSGGTWFCPRCDTHLEPHIEHTCGDRVPEVAKPKAQPPAAEQLRKDTASRCIEILEHCEQSCAEPTPAAVEAIAKEFGLCGDQLPEPAKPKAKAKAKRKKRGFQVPAGGAA
jgi:hypothetical protein